ncbi:sigma 54-interacting transcriptional regulator [Geoalkalibacter sp.]|uniref:sigma 54-interacting transcriptional regulator n=1 Tax=Geoalkalibacter sp. TaxID=3041440 RepID=UPI00272DEC57|nr:sigma 54-interacting transcriptional regulator [Geoalkalibacter sp.]
MARLDVRVKTGLRAKAVYATERETREDAVTIRELSLAGAVIEPLGGRPRDFFTLRAQLPPFGEVELLGDVVRMDGGHAAAVRLFYSDRQTSSTLWRYIHSHLQPGTECPYCGQERPADALHCRHCGYYLEFNDQSYLDEHLRETLGARIQNRVKSLPAQQCHRIIGAVEAELLKSRKAPAGWEFVGTCPAMRDVFSMITKVATTDLSVLILGESGTGKELTAKAIHERSARKQAPFVPFNCAAIPEGLLEAELFGYQRGSFTGAAETKKGKFELADGGTIFLDEIGDLSPPLQAKLLRFLEDRIVERIGAKKGKRVDVRIIAATNCDIHRRMEEESFREDLFFRLNAFCIKLPPLRERGEDKVVLARFFLNRICQDGRFPVRGLSEQAVEAIRRYEWPGNVREMINKMRRAAVMAAGDLIQPADLELETSAPVPATTNLRRQVSKSKKDLVLAALRDNDYVIARTARALGISRPSLYSIMKKFNIEH